MIRLDDARRIIRVDVQRIQKRADLLDGAEVLDDRRPRVQNAAFGGEV